MNVCFNGHRRDFHCAKFIFNFDLGPHGFTRHPEWHGERAKANEEFVGGDWWTQFEHKWRKHRTIARHVSSFVVISRNRRLCDAIYFVTDSTCDHQFHEPLHRTQSEEPSRSQYDIGANQHHKSVCTHFDAYSRASSRQSDLETSRSDIQFSEQMPTHSRNLSQDSATSYRSIDFTDELASAVAAAAAVNHSGCIDFMDKITNRSYESNSLPRRKCMYHASDEYQTNSLPRKDASHQLRVENAKFNAHRLRAHGTFSLESSMGSNQNLNETMKRRYSCGVQDAMRYSQDSNENEDPHRVMRRNSINNFYHPPPDDEVEVDDEDDQSGSEEYCSTCESSESEEDVKQEKEIFIDFKPRLSPVPSPRHRRKRLQKTMSDGEILYEKRRESIAIDEMGAPLTSTSEEDLKTKESQRNNAYLYSNIPIKDEGICDTNNLLKLPSERDNNVRHRREAFRKRSISLEEPMVDDNTDYDNVSRKSIVKSGPPSPCLAEKDISTFPSSDSLANDLTRDHSDGIWNESQATVLQIDSRYKLSYFLFI